MVIRGVLGLRPWALAPNYFARNVGRRGRRGIRLIHGWDAEKRQKQKRHVAHRTKGTRIPGAGSV
jgi:hypothetical protein